MERFSKIYEALDLSTARRLNLKRDSSGAYTPDLNRVFKNQDRLKIAENISLELGESPAYNEILNALINLGYTASIDEYKNNIAKSIDNPKQQIRIGKILAKLNDPELEKKFKNDPARAVSKDAKFDIIITRHPYDIAGQSTGRSWRSCMSLPEKGKKGGNYCSFIRNDISSGTLIAYLVRAGDDNISKPISRVSIKPVSPKTKSHKKTLYATAYKVYGVQSNDFKPIVKKWVYRKLNDFIGGVAVHDPSLYHDIEYDQDGLRVDYENTWIDEILEMLPKNENVEISPSSFGDYITVYVNFKIPAETPIYHNAKASNIIGLNHPAEVKEDRRSNSLYLEFDLDPLNPDRGEDIDRVGITKEDLRKDLYKKIVDSGVYNLIKNYDSIKARLIELYSR